MRADRIVESAAQFGLEFFASAAIGQQDCLGFLWLSFDFLVPFGDGDQASAWQLVVAEIRVERPFDFVEVAGAFAALAQLLGEQVGQAVGRDDSDRCGDQVGDERDQREDEDATGERGGGQDGGGHGRDGTAVVGVVLNWCGHPDSDHDRGDDADGDGGQCGDGQHGGAGSAGVGSGQGQ